MNKFLNDSVNQWRWLHDASNLIHGYSITVSHLVKDVPRNGILFSGLFSLINVPLQSYPTSDSPHQSFCSLSWLTPAVGSWPSGGRDTSCHEEPAERSFFPAWPCRTSPDKCLLFASSLTNKNNQVLKQDKCYALSTPFERLFEVTKHCCIMIACYILLGCIKSLDKLDSHLCQAQWTLNDFKLLSCDLWGVKSTLKWAFKLQLKPFLTHITSSWVHKKNFQLHEVLPEIPPVVPLDVYLKVITSSDHTWVISTHPRFIWHV